MFDLAKRKLTLGSNSTPVHIGPTTYDLDELRLNLPHFAPFNVGAVRKTTTAQRQWTEVIYDADFRPKVKGGSSISDRAVRFPYVEDDIPGPATYDPLLVVKKAVTKRKDEMPVPKHNGKLYLCRVPFSQGINPPSVPSKHLDANGYDIEKKSGDMKKNPPDDRDTTLGPAFYTLPDELNINSKRYRGCRWAGYRGGRSNAVKNFNPGPGEYDTDCYLCLPRCDDILVREAKRKAAYLPRYLDKEVANTQRNNFPAPCDYTVVKRRSVQPSSAPFFVGAERFTSKYSIGPGPTKYKVCGCYRDKKRFAVGDVPFCCTADRFKKTAGSSNPGANEYKPRDTIADVNSKAVLKAKNLKGGFCTSAPRKWAFVAHDWGFPSPGDYDVKDLRNPLASNYTCKFKSRDVRFPDNAAFVTPDPATYDATSAFKKAYYQRSYKKDGRLLEPKEAFNCSAAKFKKIYDFAGRVIGCENPGPAGYCPPVAPMDKGYHFPKVNRFKDQEEEGPGPGQYSFHFKHTSAIAKARDTYNTRLAAAVEKRTKTAPPILTFARRLRGQKKLRWFSRPSKYYRHCIEVQ